MYEFYPDTEERDAFMAAMRETGRLTDFEIQLKNQDGSLIPCSISAKISFDAQGRPEKIIGSMRDISTRKQAEEVLKRSEERLRITLEATKIGIWEWDLKNNVMYASPTMYSMLGCKPDEKIKDHDIWLDRIHPEDRQMVEDKTKNAFTSQTENYEYTVRMKHADGSYRWINVQGYVMDEDASGNATQYRESGWMSLSACEPKKRVYTLRLSWNLRATPL